ncbi:hypothetical protein OIU85_004965 [Salix viminalis]|uniref:MSP domain-containing protein n=1 Tax=Salix viminalis TaxID=40686 RepID=A0A9Q0PUE0_SALVM|nr:hypothetical protein OIU85_004965 [Salix viminalis]
MTQLLEILPKELKFIVEVKKQSSCSIQLTNNTYHNVAFKVKTTSPKKYSVRPNVGIVDPKSTFEFFAKDNGKHVEEVKMRVALISPPESPVLSPINGVLKQGPFFEPSVLKDPVENRVEILAPPQTGPFFEPSVLKDPVENRVEILAPPQTIAKRCTEKSDKRKKSAHGIPTPICCYDCAHQYHGGIPFTSLNT